MKIVTAGPTGMITIFNLRPGDVFSKNGYTYVRGMKESRRAMIFCTRLVDGSRYEFMSDSECTPHPNHVLTLNPE